MLKSLIRWIDSWSTTAQPEILNAENSKIQWLRILPFILLHLACLAVFWVGVSWFAVGFMLLFYLIRMFSITAFFHRYLSHKTFQTSRTVQFLFLLLGTMSAQRGPLWWAAHHRCHHRYTDSSQDPHSSTHGFWYSHVGWFLNEYKYPELIWLDRFSLIVVLLTAGGVYALGEWFAIAWPQLGTSGLQLLVWGFVVSTVLLIHATLCINSLAHHYGSRDFETDDQSRNNLFLSIITLGEGWHNNHHYYAGSTRQGFYWWQIDVTYYLLKIMSWFGIVWSLKPIPARVYDVSKIAQLRKQKKLTTTGAHTIQSKELQ